MTKTHYVNPLSNNNLRIPSREEFHRYASNKLAYGDFCTDYSSGYQTSKVAQSIDWTIKNAKKKGNR